MRVRHCVCALASGAVIAAGGAAARGWAVRNEGIDLERVEAWARRPELRLRRVDFVGLRTLDARGLWTLAGVEPDTALIDIDPGTVETALATHPRIESARAARVPPDRLVIGITERVPVAVDGERLAGLDRRGRRFPVSPRELKSLPRLTGDVTAGLAVVEAAAELGIPLSGVDAADPRAIRVRVNGWATSLRLAQSPARELRRWLRLRDSGLLARYAPREIDLRFGGSAVLTGFENEGGIDGSR